jgi:hypothetical protein
LVPEAQEHFLGHILGLRRAVEDAPGQAVDGPAVTAVHLGQRHLAIAGNSGDELRITDFTDLLHVISYSEPPRSADVHSVTRSPIIGPSG